MPRVSIVTATYNRANVLRFAIESVLASTFGDWELIVVGDACTDETEAVVRSFGDARIRFLDLPVSSGEQATPNNEGARAARGEYLAFLNHDDLWTRDHLETGLAAIEHADFVSTLTIVIDRNDVPHLEGHCPSGAYEPHVAIRASSWLLRRALYESAGPWRPAREIFDVPSQEWLLRASRTGARMRSIAKPTVLAINSGGRPRSYAERQFETNARWSARLRDEPELMSRLMAEIALRLHAENHDVAAARHLRRAGKALVRRLAKFAGVHHWALRNALLFRRRGGYLDALRRTRGLPPLPR